MKPLSSTALSLGCLALGIVLGKGPLASGSASGTAQPGDPAAAANRAAKSTREAPASLHPGISTIRKAAPGELAGLTEQATTMTDPVEVQRLLSECLLHMTAENWQDVVATFGKISTTTGRDPASEWKLALFRSGQVAGAEAMDSLRKHGFEKKDMGIWQTLYGWSSRDPLAALDWLQKTELENGKKVHSDFYSALVAGSALNDPQGTINLLDRIPADRRSECAGHLVWNVVQNGGTGALDPLLSYAAALDRSDPNNQTFADQLFKEATDKLLWKADAARDVQQGCDVVLKLAKYGCDPNLLTQSMIGKYRWYGMQEKIQILETLNGAHGDKLQLDSLTSSVMSTMNGDGDQVAVREWIDQHPDSPLVPHLKSFLP